MHRSVAVLWAEPPTEAVPVPAAWLMSSRRIEGAIEAQGFPLPTLQCEAKLLDYIGGQARSPLSVVRCLLTVVCGATVSMLRAARWLCSLFLSLLAQLAQLCAANTLV